MELDWFTVAAQVVNFLVLVWLLRRFLYRPVMRAMERREARIAERLEEAEAKRAEAEDEAESLREARSELERRREEALEEARAEAEARREEMEEELEREMAERREARLEELEAERESFLADLRRRTARHVNALARAALSEFVDASLERTAARRFAERLDEAEDEALARLSKAARESGEGPLVESPRPLDEDSRARVAEALAKRMPEAPEPRFETAEELILGLRVSAGGQVLEWSLSDHLQRLERFVEDELDRAAGAKRKAA